MPFAFISGLSYFALFAIMVVEGPVVTSAASFAARFGFFSLSAIFVLSILGDLAGDFIYYSIGFTSRKTIIDSHGHKFGLDVEKVSRLDAAFHKHRIRSLIIAKLAPALPGPVLIAAGALRLDLWTLIWVSIVVAVPKYLLFMALGYSFGSIYVAFFRYYDIVGWILAAVLIFGSYFLYKWAMRAVLREAGE